MITVVARFLSAAMKQSDIEVMKVINLLNSYNVNKPWCDQRIFFLLLGLAGFEELVEL